MSSILHTTSCLYVCKCSVYRILNYLKGKNSYSGIDQPYLSFLMLRSNITIESGEDLVFICFPRQYENILVRKRYDLDLVLS